MNNVTDLVYLIQDVLELPIVEQDINTPFDELGGWDSLGLLRLITSIEIRTGKKVSVLSMLQARTIRDIYESIQ
ncbi:MAG: acyl carrier protein [Nostoc sp. ChiSLP01]|nr:acyl carrier protein [Nostoc sp. CmiSLP01]MDZ8286540.1 acyl carrier protein [Nostoc sp. ChiSLP01]